MARNVAMSRAPFSRLLRAETGESPMQLVRRLRLEEAYRLALATHDPLKQIAVATGLSSESNLSRLLLARFGVGIRELPQRVCR